MDSFDNITRVEKNALPDKIYIRTGMSGLFYGSKEKSFETDAEYIRKDALFEMLKGYSHPLTRVVVQELIDKINEL